MDPQFQDGECCMRIVCKVIQQTWISRRLRVRDWICGSCFVRNTVSWRFGWNCLLDCREAQCSQFGRPLFPSGRFWTCWACWSFPLSSNPCKTPPFRCWRLPCSPCRPSHCPTWTQRNYPQDYWLIYHFWNFSYWVEELDDPNRACAGMHLKAPLLSRLYHRCLSP